MEMYLIKSAGCLAILLTFYKIFLEKESMHTFKRFYLLLALLASFGIPLLTFTYYIEAAPLNLSNSIIENGSLPLTQANVEASSPVNWTAILWTIYGLGALFFGIRFLLNLSRIVKRIQSNPKTKRQSFINVLLNDLVIPHTFFHYIFLNKSKFEKQEIPEEVLLHEQTHANQQHSADVLLIEILQVVFWFNPLLYLIKKDIKLNHEFLADQAVMNRGFSLTTYQHLLLGYSSNASEPLLANAINYSLIKKRFNIMKKRTSKKTMWIRSFILLPLLAILIFSFSNKEHIESAETATALDSLIQQKSASREQMAEFNKLAKHYNTALKDDNGVNIKLKHVERLKYIYSIMSDKQRQDAESFPDFPKPPPPPSTPDAPKAYKKDMIPPPPPVPPNATPAQKAKYKKVIADYNKNEMIPPPPPPPPDPVKHMKQMAKEDATFYYEGKEITAKEAIKIAQDNDGINIQIQDHVSEKPIVKLSTKPIQLKKHN